MTMRQKIIVISLSIGITLQHLPVKASELTQQATEVNATVAAAAAAVASIATKPREGTPK